MNDPAPAAGDRPSGIESSRRAPLAPSPRPIAELVELHFDFIWRSLRRMGLEAADADDATQEVFVIAARHQDHVAAEKERAFLFGTAYRVASLHWRTQRRYAARLDVVATVPPPSPASPEELVTRREARAELDRVLDALELDLRTVFVLFELEELTVPQIAELLELKEGTVASRLRRAREVFRAAVARRDLRRAFGGGEP